MDFQPIETVPRDGALVVLRDLDGRMICAEIRRTDVSLHTLGKSNAPQTFDEKGELGSWLKWALAETG
jgi:hypothetical protein